MQKIKIPDSQGKNISANVYAPQNITESLAILCPGYLHSKDYGHIVKLAESLSNRGYTVVSFDPIGTWESDGDISDYTISHYLIDIKNVLEHMKKNGNYTNILLGGHSRGGAVSILFAVNEPSISEVLGIMPSPLAPLPDERYTLWKKRGIERSFRAIPGKKEQKEFSVPFSYAEDRKKYNILEAVKKLKVPIVLVSGEKDTRVSTEDVEKIFKTATSPKVLIQIPKANHNYWEDAAILNLVNDKILMSL